MKTLNTQLLGKRIIHYKTIDSTQLEIWRRIKKNKIETGTIIKADIQTNGIGTHGRIWHTDEENNIAFSMYLKTHCDVNKIKNLTITIAEIIVKIIKEQYDKKLQIKEPNDIVYNNKKIGGILTETKLVGNKVKCIVIGIGINTNQQNFNREISDIATSIKKEFNIEVDNNEFMIEFCNRFEEKIYESKIL